MKTNHIRSTAAIFLMAAGLTSATNAVAHDVVAPCWRGQAGATYQEWDFLSSANPASPTIVTNGYGNPQASITGIDDYFATWPNSTNLGWWGLFPAGSIALNIPNQSSPPANSSKLIWVQVAQLIGGLTPNYCTVSIPGATYLGGERRSVETVPPFSTLYVDQTMWRLEPCPTSETVTVTAVSSALIDQIVIETYTPPVANTNNLGRARDTAMKIPIADLTADDVDPGSGTIVLAGINLTTTNGVTLVTNATTIFYTNAANVNDQFTYTISNGDCGTIVGYVNITVTNGLGVVIVPTATGTEVTLTFYGIPGHKYIVQRSANLVDWVDASGELTAPSSPPNIGLVQYTETPPTNPAYYRIRQP